MTEGFPPPLPPILPPLPQAPPPPQAPELPPVPQRPGFDFGEPPEGHPPSPADWNQPYPYWESLYYIQPGIGYVPGVDAPYFWETRDGRLTVPEGWTVPPPGPSYQQPWRGTGISYDDWSAAHTWVPNPDYRPVIRFDPNTPAPPEEDYARGRWVLNPLVPPNIIGDPIQPALPPPVEGYSPIPPAGSFGPFDAWRRPAVYQFQRPFWGNLGAQVKDFWEESKGSYQRGVTRAGRIMRSPGWRLLSAGYSAYQWAQYAAALQKRTGIQTRAGVPGYAPRPGPVPPYRTQPRGGGGVVGPRTIPIAGGPNVDLTGFFGSMVGTAANYFLGGGIQEGGPMGWGRPRGAPGPYYGGAMPGGAPISPGPAIQAGFDMPFMDIAPQGTMSGMGGTCITPRARGSVGYPSTVQFMAPTPSGNTRVKTYKDKGSCLLYSDDLAACKRVKRVAARARRAVGGR